MAGQEYEFTFRSTPDYGHPDALRARPYRAQVIETGPIFKRLLRVNGSYILDDCLSTIEPGDIVSVTQEEYNKVGDRKWTSFAYIGKGWVERKLLRAC